ncbi:unnamed protein product [Parascedosporium putredinis]|uniref:chitin synthase n=1 Tax=Parascedosporium putredinis TaxID=1442378 RepID=A0A9P1GY67_9PEZI|nr:unnamed protein product [Parascedosporium putredinis]CAI7989652.1 unnamed protein product [Parascedosporium putredinis]
MVYAFNNWHDVSWGTKGSDKADTLPSAKVLIGKDADSGVMVEEPEREQEDIDSQFKKTVYRALAPYEERPEDEKKDPEDSYRSFRTGLVIFWLLTNLVIITAVTSNDFESLGVPAASKGRTPIYFRVLLYSTAALSLVRFIGFLWFLGRTGLMAFVARR